MNSALYLIAFFAVPFAAAYSNAPLQTAARPTGTMERFAKQSTARVIWSKQVGRIDTGRAHAVVTALAIEDPEQVPAKMSGIRIDLSEGNLRDRVYMDAASAEHVVDALVEISNEMPGSFLRVSNLNGSGQSGCLGSGFFWQQQGHSLSASMCLFPVKTTPLAGSGLLVSTGDATFWFVGMSPTPFAVAITRAADELKGH